MASLYAPEERLAVADWLKRRFGTDDCPAGQENVWRLALTGQINTSYNFFAHNFIWITDKKKRRVNLRPFVVQAIHRVALDSQLRAELPGYVVEFKPRQIGGTIENIGRALHYVLDEDSDALILVDDEDVASKQALRFNAMLNALPPWLQPMRRLQSMKQIAFENPNPKDRIANPGLNSGIQITVPSSFRGVPPGFVCVSEYAHMEAERQDQVQEGIISAAAMTPNSIIIIDTTPNGFDESYHPMVMEACADNPKWTKRIEGWSAAKQGELRAQDVLDGILGVPDSVAKGYPTMVPSIGFWRFHEEYDCRSKANPLGELPPLSKEQKAETEATLGNLSKYGGEEEVELRDKYGVSTSRLFWRRRKIDRYKLKTEEMKLMTFRQEFAGATVEEGFVESSKAPFPRDCLDALRRQKRHPSAIGLFDGEGRFRHWEYQGENYRGDDHRDPNPFHEIRIYAPPENDEKYTMGVDCDNAYESPDSDATVAQIVRRRDCKLVATYEARVGSFELIKQLMCLYRWYWNCYYAIENQVMGYDLIRRCIDEAHMTNSAYYKRLDKDYPEQTSYPGWDSSKPFARAQMDQMLLEMICHRNPVGKAEPACIIPDGKTINEICNLSRTNTGAFKNTRGGKDDHVDALEIAWCIAMDPFGGSNSKKAETPPEQEYPAAFGGGQPSRSKPDLAYI